jgi:hypothetical protein
MPLMSIEAICALLKEQAALRSSENDEGGILKEIAAKLAADVEEMDDDGGNYTGFGSVDMPCVCDKSRCCPDDETCCQTPTDGW